MPNWVFNELHIRKKDMDKVVNKDGEVDFEILLPMPETMRKTISPVRKDTIYIYLSEKCNKKVKEEDLKKYKISERDIKEAEETISNPLPEYAHIFEEDNKYECGDDGRYKCLTHITPEEHISELYKLGKTYVDNIDTYGIAEWYDWSVNSWGCKWNASNTEVYPNNIEDLAGDAEITISFDTPWDFPEKWIEKVSEVMPFHLAWEEEQGFRGVVNNNNYDGDYLEVELPMLEWEEDEEGDLTEKDDTYGEDWRNYLNDEDKRSEEAYEKWDGEGKEIE